MRPVVVAVLAAALCTGCFRTVYSNVTPGLEPGVAPTTTSTRKPHKGWQNFFVYGWAPSERPIDAAGMCGGARHVERIETQRTFVQGLVASFAGYIINIYSPWNGKVVCEGAEPAKRSRRRGSSGS